MRHATLGDWVAALACLALAVIAITTLAAVLTGRRARRR